jgi:hypothetical protein
MAEPQQEMHSEGEMVETLPLLGLLLLEEAGLETILVVMVE